MEYFKKIFKESIISLLVTTSFGLMSGSVLSINVKIFRVFPMILLIIPVLNDLVGDISTILVARLTTALYLGEIKPKVHISENITKNFISLLITILLCLGFAIGLGYLIGYVTGIELINPILFITILLLTTLILFIAMFLFLFIGSIYIFKTGKDPNNFLIPFTTTVADFLTPTIIVFLIKIFI